MSARGHARVDALERVAALTSELWLIDLDRESPALEDAERRLPRLSDEEVARGDSLKDTAQRTRWRAAHIGLRLLLERWCGAGVRKQRFEIAEGGRPFLPLPSPYFSLSHSAGAALIALSGHGPIGVDIEVVAPAKMPAQRRRNLEALAEALASVPLACDGDARLVQAWTRIEALGKLDGHGIGRLLTRTGIVGGGPLRLDYALPDAPDEARAEAMNTGDAAAARSCPGYRIRDIAMGAIPLSSVASGGLASGDSAGAAALVDATLRLGERGGASYVAALACRAADAAHWPALLEVRRDLTVQCGDI